MIRRIATGVVVAAALAVSGACSTGAPAPQAAPPPPAPALSAPAPGSGPSAPAPADQSAPGQTSAGSDEAAIRTALDDYNKSLVDRDFATSCAALTPQARSALLAKARSGKLPAGSCEQALTAIYQVPGTGAVADEISRSTRVSSVAVNGDQATVSFTATVRGRSTPAVSTRMARMDGRWLIAST